MRRGLEAVVAPTALAAFRNHHSLSVFNDVGDELTGLSVVHDRTKWHAHEEVRRVGTVTLLLRAVFTVLCEVMRAVLELNERVEVAIAHENDVTSAASVTTIGATLHDRLLASEVGDAVAALSAAHMDDGFINKHGVLSSEERPQRAHQHDLMRSIFSGRAQSEHHQSTCTSLRSVHCRGRTAPRRQPGRDAETRDAKKRFI